ncbi:MAG: hypothetical protein K0Q55_3582, partial [Verrucomicrobia bacterium]|nr:hypothetical protein [Verrucomicrobiota bacterium]
TSSVLQEKLGDLLVKDKKPAEALKAYSTALELKPTRKQQLRLLLAQAEVLASSDKAADAVDVYLKIERLYPDYPDMTALYQKALPLAQKTGRAELVEKYQKAIEKK